MRETRSAFIEMHPRGCIIVRVRHGFSQNVDHARENVATCIELSAGNRSTPLLVNITNTAPLDSEVRHYYVGGALADNFCALGLVVEASPLGRMMGNVFFRMMNAYRSDKGNRIPTRLFASEDVAIAWLTEESR